MTHQPISSHQKIAADIDEITIRLERILDRSLEESCPPPALCDAINALIKARYQLEKYAQWRPEQPCETDVNSPLSKPSGGRQPGATHGQSRCLLIPSFEVNHDPTMQVCAELPDLLCDRP